MNNSYMKWTLLNAITQQDITIDLCRKSGESTSTSDWKREPLLIAESHPEVMMAQYTGSVVETVDMLGKHIGDNNYHPILLMQAVIISLNAYARNIDNFTMAIINKIDPNVEEHKGLDIWMQDNIENKGNVLYQTLAVLCNQINVIYNIPSKLKDLTDADFIQKTTIEICEEWADTMSGVVEILKLLRETPPNPPGMREDIDVSEEMMEILKNLSPEELAQFDINDVGDDVSETAKKAFSKIPESLQCIKDLGIAEAGKLMSERNSKK